MATDLVGNEKLQRFISLLAELNHQSSQMLKTGDMRLLTPMNDTVEEMYSIQQSEQEEAYTVIEEDMQSICMNFNAMVVMLKSNDKDVPDTATNLAVKKFVRNIFEATVRIVHTYGLA